MEDVIQYKEIPGVSSKYKAGSDGNIYSFFKDEPKKKLSSRLGNGRKYAQEVEDERFCVGVDTRV